MLDLTTIPVVDNHCHPVLRQQTMSTALYRSYFTEATHTSFAEVHVPHTVYYLWMLRQLAGFWGCAANENAVLAFRDTMSADELVRRLYQAANIDTLILDVAHPAPEVCYSAEQMASVGQCRTEKMLRLETLMQRLVVEHDDFDALVEHFSTAISNVRAQGYVAYKSIVAYRTGLEVMQWSKDDAVASFARAREEAVRQDVFRIAHKPLIDYLLYIAFAQAAQEQIPLQFHTGYGDSDTDMRLGNPLHLRAVFENSAYWSMPIVLLHESYPYSQLGAYLAATYPHVYFDLSYTIPFVDKLEMLAFTRQALSVAPATKLMYSSDGIHLPEMHWAAATRGRSVLAQVLQEMIAEDELDEQQAYQLAQQVLHDTAYTVYRL